MIFPASVCWEDTLQKAPGFIGVGEGEDIRFTPKSGHVQCTSGCLLWANSGHRDDYGRSGNQRSHSRQSHPDFGELAGLRIDLDRATMLLHNDVVTDGESEPRSFSGRLGCEERVEHLFPHLGGNP